LNKIKATTALVTEKTKQIKQLFNFSSSPAFFSLPDTKR